MIRVNLLPIRETLRKQDLKRFIVHAVIGAVVTIMLMIGSYWYYDRELSLMQTRLAGIKKERDQLSEKTKQLFSLIQEDKRLKDQVTQIRKLVERKESIALLLEAVSLAIPDDVWLEKLEKQPNRFFRLEGKSKNNKSVMTFVDQLRNVKQDFTEKHPFLDKEDPAKDTLLNEIKLVKLEAAQSADESGDSLVVFSVEGIMK